MFQFRTPPPDVSAAAADWQINSEPIVVGGLTYYPTRGFRLFDGQVMAQTGLFDDVPGLLRTRRSSRTANCTCRWAAAGCASTSGGASASWPGTTGSHVPTFPVDSPSFRAARTASSAIRRGRHRRTPRAERGRAASRSARSTASGRVTPIDHDGVAHTATRTASGWNSTARGGSATGAAVSFSPDRFEPIGEYRGFPVYRDTISGSDRHLGRRS